MEGREAAAAIVRDIASDDFVGADQKFNQEMNRRIVAKQEERVRARDATVETQEE